MRAWTLALAAMSRREFVAAASLAAAGAACRQRSAGGRGKALDAGAWMTLDALTARILPGTTGAGARAAGVVAFIDAQLATAALRPALNAVTGAIRLLDAWAQRRHGARFAELEDDQQDAVLGALAAGSIPSRGFPQREVFRLLHSLTLEGFLADPRHGGNAGEVGWRTVGFVAPGRRRPGETGHDHGH